MDEGKKAEKRTRGGGSLTFTVRCTLEQLREIERAAIAAGLPRSRFVVQKALVREPEQGRTGEAPPPRAQNQGSPRKWSSNIEDLALDPTWTPDFQGEDLGDEPPPGEIYRSPQAAGGEAPPGRAREPKQVLQPATSKPQGKRSLLRGPAEDAALRAADLAPRAPHPGGLQGELLETPPPEPDQEDPEAVKAQENIFTTWGRKDSP